MTTDAPAAPSDDTVKRHGTTLELGLATSTEQIEEPAADENPATADDDELPLGGKPVIKPDNWSKP